MADSSQAAAQTLRAAAETFRSQCANDPDCEHISAAAATLIREINLAYPSSSRKPGENTPVSEQPKTLAGAAKTVRDAFQASRAKQQ